MKKYKRDNDGIKAFGDRLREVRRSFGLSQEDLANMADLEVSQISRIERGIISTSLSQIFLIAKTLKIHPKELFDFEI